MFTRLLSLWVTGALLLPLNWGTTLGDEDNEDVTPTPDYDYNSTFDYYLYNNTLGDEDNEDVTPTPDYDYNSTFDYYLYNVSDDTSSINYDMYEVLRDTKNQGNTDSVSVYRHYGILAGLLVLHICQQT